MKIYLVRHTDAEDDLYDTYGGVSDDPLIDKGIEYAKQVAQELKDSGIQIIFTSPHKRAKQTADILAEAINVEVIEKYNLRERNSYGVISGLTKEKVQKLMPHIFERIKEMKERGEKASKTIETLPGGEVYLDLIQRIKAVFKDMIRESKSKNLEKIAVVSHGGFTWALFNSVFNVDKKPKKGEVIQLEGDSLEGLKIVS